VNSFFGGIENPHVTLSEAKSLQKRNKLTKGDTSNACGVISMTRNITVIQNDPEQSEGEVKSLGKTHVTLSVAKSLS